MRKLQAKCKQCGKKLKPNYPDKNKGKWVYICKDCCGFKYTKGDKRTIEDRYDKDVLSFIRKQFNRKFMSFAYNPEVLRERIFLDNPNSIKSKIKVNRNMRRYSFEYISKITKEKFPNKKTPSTYVVGYYFRKLYGAHVFRRYGKRDPYAERDSFT